MKLYGSLLSPFVMRPVLAARAKGHELEPEPFEGGSKSPAYLALSPMGKIPLLVDGDFVLPESQTITDYLDRVLDGPKLSPENPQQAAHARLIVRLVDIYLIPHLVGVFEARDKPAGLAPALASIGDAMGFIEHYWSSTGDFAVGEHFSVADAALIPLLFFFDALDKGVGTGKLIAERPGIAAWWARAKATPLGSRAYAEQTEGLKLMQASR